jgi:hypothetical protein
VSAQLPPLPHESSTRGAPRAFLVHQCLRVNVRITSKQATTTLFQFLTIHNNLPIPFVAIYLIKFIDEHYLLYRLLRFNRRFGGKCCIYPQGRKISRARSYVKRGGIQSLLSRWSLARLTLQP